MTFLQFPFFQFRAHAVLSSDPSRALPQPTSDPTIPTSAIFWQPARLPFKLRAYSCFSTYRLIQGGNLHRSEPFLNFHVEFQFL